MRVTTQVHHSCATAVSVASTEGQSDCKWCSIPFITPGRPTARTTTSCQVVLLNVARYGNIISWMVEAEGFEPSEPDGPAAPKATAIGRSATPPSSSGWWGLRPRQPPLSHAASAAGMRQRSSLRVSPFTGPIAFSSDPRRRPFSTLSDDVRPLRTRSSWLARRRSELRPGQRGGSKFPPHAA